MTTTLSASTARAMLDACEDHFTQLITDGCAEDVALDRTWDAYVCAFAQSLVHCFDPRDRLFETRLRTIAAKERFERGNQTCVH